MSLRGLNREKIKPFGIQSQTIMHKTVKIPVF